MKRFILLVLAITLIIPASFTQSLSLSNASGPLADGATVFVWGDLTNFMVAYVNVTNNSSSAINVKVVRVENSIIPGSTNYVCWDLCYDPQTDTTGTVSIAGGATNTSNFSADYSPNGNPGTSNITYVFFDTENPNDKVSFNVDFYGSPASINETGMPTVQISKAYPNPASESFAFDYTIPKDSRQVRVVVRDILGSIIHDVDIQAGKGTLRLSTEGMKEGIYFYSVYQGSQILATRKLVIK